MRNIKRNQEQNIEEQNQTCKAQKSSASSLNAQKHKRKLPKRECDRL
jgi:hypothetical protein